MPAVQRPSLDDLGQSIVLLGSPAEVVTNEWGLSQCTLRFACRNDRHAALAPRRGTRLLDFPVTDPVSQTALAELSYLAAQSTNFTRNGYAPGVGVLDVLCQGANFPKNPFIQNADSFALLQPMYIDAGEEYTIVLPFFGASEVGFEPIDDFTISNDGPVLTVEYTGDPVTEATIFNLTVWAKVEGQKFYQTVQISVAPAWYNGASNMIPVATNNGRDTSDNDDHKILWAPGGINGRFEEDDQLRFGATQNDHLAPNYEEQTLYVVEIIGDDRFKVSTTMGGSELGSGAFASGSYRVSVVTTVASSDVIYVADTADLAVDDEIELAYSNDRNGAADGPSDYTGPVYVKQIIDGYRIKIAATVGGAALVSTVTSAVDPDGVDPKIYRNALGRLYPVIDSAPTIEVAVLGAVSYTLTSDTVGATFGVVGLPDGLTFDGVDEISGNPTTEGYYAVLLQAIDDPAASIRFLLITVGSPEMAQSDLTTAQWEQAATKQHLVDRTYYAADITVRYVARSKPIQPRFLSSQFIYSQHDGAVTINSPNPIYPQIALGLPELTLDPSTALEDAFQTFSVQRESGAAYAILIETEAEDIEPYIELTGLKVRPAGEVFDVEETGQLKYRIKPLSLFNQPGFFTSL